MKIKLCYYLPNSNTFDYFCISDAEIHERQLTFFYDDNNYGLITFDTERGRCQGEPPIKSVIFLPDTISIQIGNRTAFEELAVILEKDIYNSDN